MAANISADENIIHFNKKFFKDAIENGLETTGIEITSLEVSIGSNPGDNYSSKIYRAKITYRQNGGVLQPISLIIKCIPYSEVRKVLFDLELFDKEVILYKTVIPKMTKMLPGIKVSPKFFYAVKEPVHSIVFEDLRVQGFTLGNRQLGLNETECKLLLENLGKYHGSSMVLLEKEPELFKYKGFTYGMFLPEVIDEPLMKTFFFDSLKTLIPLVEKWTGYEKYAAKLKNLQKNYSERLLDIVRPIDEELRVLIHGDLWVNNLMFKYNSNDARQAVDIRFLDFQNFFVTNPGIDLNYFFFTSVQYDVLTQQKDALIECYYNSLRSTLETLKYNKIPSLEQIKYEFRRKTFYGVVAAIAVLPIICIDEKDSKDCSLELFSDEEAAKNKLLLSFRTKRFEQLMKYLLKYADELGALD